MSERLCVVMPVYNEREAIGAVLEKWDAALSALGIDYEIRPYNDGSKDDSLQVMRRVASSLKSVSVRDKPNGGHGNTILTGYREAASDGFDWVFQIDSDDEMGPEKFNELWSRRNDFDFLVGIRDGRVQALPRKIISLVSRLCVRIFYGKSIWDVNTPYRLMRVSVFEEFFASIPLNTFAPNVILSGLAARHKIRCFETRVPQHDRTTGEVSIKKWKLLKAAIRSFWQTITFAIKGVGYRCLFLMAVLILSVFCFMSNPFANSSGTDGSVFAYVGRALIKGDVPYLNVFDHKGPLIYAINALGYVLCNNYLGIWVFESFLFCGAFIFLYRFLSFYVKEGRYICAAIGCTVLLYMMCAFGGNMTETYAFPIILIMMIVFYENVLAERQLSYVVAGFMGVGTGLILLLRPNMAALSIVIAIYVTKVCFSTRNFIRFILTVLHGFVGMVISMMPFYLWLQIKGAGNAFVECYIDFNFTYVAQEWQWNNSLLLPIGIIVGSVITRLLIQKNHMPFFDSIWPWNMMFQGIALVVILIRPGQTHYILPFIPAVVVPLVAMFGMMKKKVVIGFVVIGFLGISTYALRANFSISKWMNGYYDKGVVGILDCRTSRDYDFLKEIIDEISDKDSVLVVGNECEIYNRFGLFTKSRYPFQTPISQVSQEIRNCVESDIENMKDAAVIITPNVRRKYTYLATAVEKSYVFRLSKNGYSLYLRQTPQRM